MIRKIEDVKVNKSKILRTPKIEISTVSVSKSEFIKVSDSDSSSFDVSRGKSTIFTTTNQTPKIERHSSPRITQTPRVPRDGKTIRRNIFIIVAIAVIIGILYLLSTVFLKANVKIISKNESFDLSGKVFHASKNGNIPFELMIVSLDGSKDITLTQTKEVSEKAKGEITLYNEYSDKPEKILAGTFVSDSKGKTYKTDKTVTIPGFKKDKLKIVAGEVPVGITSFLAGDAYNSDSLSFNINSFKDTAKYKKIYGKIKTPLTGGISGLVYVLSDAEKATALSDVSTFQDKVLRKLNAEIPEGYILYKDGVKFTYESNQDVFSKVPDTVLSIKGTAGAYIFKKDMFEDYMIDKLLPDISDKERSEIVPPDLLSLSFNFMNKDQPIDKDVDSFDFELTGNLNIKWNPNIDSLKALLVGKDKKEVPSIFKEDKGVLSASVKIVPFWSSKLPLNMKKINITVD